MQNMGLYETNSFLICGVDSSFVHSTWEFTVDITLQFLSKGPAAKSDPVFCGGA
jgi:hypothetical protein